MARLAVACLALMVAACSGPPPPETPDSARLQDALHAAREYGVSDAQLEILERALARGEVTLGDLREAIDNTFACFEEHGITHSSQQMNTYLGHSQVSYSFGAPPGFEDDDPAWLALAEACMSNNSSVIENLYQTLPSVELLQQQFFVENMRDDLSACLARFGVTAPAGADIVWYSEATGKLVESAGTEECAGLMNTLSYGG